MGVLAWWLLPLIATGVAIVWLWWRGRTGAGEPGHVHSTKELEKMRKAIEKPLPKRVAPMQADPKKADSKSSGSKPTDSQSGPA